MKRQPHWRAVVCAVFAVLLGLALLVAAQAPAPKPSGKPDTSKLPQVALPKIAGLESLPAGCQQARERADEWRAELDAGVSPQAKAAAQQSVAGHDPSISDAKAWSDFATGALLMGDLDTAAWAGLTAATQDWKDYYVANAGVYLNLLGRFQDALQLLDCAYQMGYRSPFLLEALAVAHHGLGNQGEARRTIREALQLAPHDPVIEAEDSFLHTGQPPPAPPQAPDGLGRCLAALEQHSQRVLTRVRERHQKLDRLTGETSRAEAFAGLPQIHEDGLNHARQFAQQARQARDVMQYNNALGECVTFYFLFTDNLLNSYFADSGSTLEFWAEVVRLDPPVFVRDTRLNADSLLMWARRVTSARVDDEYTAKLEESGRQYWRELKACDPDCPREAQLKQCQRDWGHYERWSALHEQRLNLAARNFDNVALRWMNIAEAELADAWIFASRTARDLKGGGRPMGGLDGRLKTSAAFTLEMINVGYRTALLEPKLNPDRPHSAAAFLTEQAAWFAQQRSWMEGRLDPHKQPFSDTCEALERQLLLEELMQELWAEHRQELWDQMMSNIEANWDPTLSCGFSADGVGVKVDDTGKWGVSGKYKWLKTKVGPGGAGTIGAGPFSVDIQDGEIAGISVDSGVEVGQIAGKKIEGGGVKVGLGPGGVTEVEMTLGGYEGSIMPGVVGQGEVTTFVRKNPRTGKVEDGIGFSGTLGIGASARGVGFACYPGSGSVRFYARSFLADAARYVLSDAPPY